MPSPFVFSVEREGDRIFVSSPYHEGFVRKARQVGGRWDRAGKAWVFEARDEERVRDLLAEAFGARGDEDLSGGLVDVSLPAGDRDFERSGALRWDGWNRAYFAGRLLAERPSRDSEVRLGEGVILARGRLSRSGGSMKNPSLDFDADVVLEARGVPRSLVPDGVKIVSEGAREGDALAVLLSREAGLVAELELVRAEISALEGGGR
jgi:hypothetical protein